MKTTQSVPKALTADTMSRSISTPWITPSLPPPSIRGPGGVQPYEVMRFIRHLGMAGAGAMDVTEYAPLIDHSKNTGNLLATLLCEFMAGKAYALRGH